MIDDDGPERPGGIRRHRRTTAAAAPPPHTQLAPTTAPSLLAPAPLQRERADRVPRFPPAARPLPPRSLYGHTYTLAKKIKEGVDAVEGAEGILYQVRVGSGEIALLASI